jgi:tripartite-type tricarboxylate transporter receptor subunit TctC
MKLPRRKFLHLTTGTATSFVALRFASAQTYPTRPVRLVVGFPAGNAPDIVARLVSQPLSERLGQSFVVDNRPGAGSNIGTEIVVRAPPDGYTLLLAVVTNAINKTLYPNLDFDFIRDIAPVAMIGSNSSVLVVNPSMPVHTVPEFIAYTKANPGKISMASPGVGSANHVFGALFGMMAGVELLHVPYRGSFMADLIGGQVQVSFAPVTLMIEQIRSGKLRALAVTASSRSELLPGVPALDEFLPGYDAGNWYGFGAPRYTPSAIIEMLNKEVNAGLDEPKLSKQLADLGIVPRLATPDEFGRFVADETDKWAKTLRSANIRPE